MVGGGSLIAAGVVVASSALTVVSIMGRAKANVRARKRSRERTPKGILRFMGLPPRGRFADSGGRKLFECLDGCLDDHSSRHRTKHATASYKQEGIRKLANFSPNVNDHPMIIIGRKKGRVNTFLFKLAVFVFSIERERIGGRQLILLRKLSFFEFC